MRSIGSEAVTYDVALSEAELDKMLSESQDGNESTRSGKSRNEQWAPDL